MGIRCWKTLIAVGLVVVIASLIFLSTNLFQDYLPGIEKIIEARSLIGMVVYVFVFILSIVLTPISATPLIPIGARIWGIWVTTALSVFGWTVGAMIAFEISRRVGRPFVAKIMPLKKINRMKKLIPREHIFWTLVFFRAIMPFDGLSYVAGLVSWVSPRIFFWSTVLGLTPFCLVVSLVGTLPLPYFVVVLTVASVFMLLFLPKTR